MNSPQMPVFPACSTQAAIVPARAVSAVRTAVHKGAHLCGTAAISHGTSPGCTPCSTTQLPAACLLHPQRADAVVQVRDVRPALKGLSLRQGLRLWLGLCITGGRRQGVPLPSASTGCHARWWASRCWPSEQLDRVLVTDCRALMAASTVEYAHGTGSVTPTRYAHYQLSARTCYCAVLAALAVLAISAAHKRDEVSLAAGSSADLGHEGSQLL